MTGAGAQVGCWASRFGFTQEETMEEIGEVLRLLLYRALIKAAVLLGTLQAPEREVARFAELAKQVYASCVVAVLGQVKAGKSSFINALLQEDIAQVGATEITATITYFRYGEPDNARLPVRCFWRNREPTNEAQAFLDGLQRRDRKTLRQAHQIDHLEYALSNDTLKGILLVDTPGTGSDISQHDETTQRFLRENKVDGCIYLIQEVPTSADRELLEAFRQATGGLLRDWSAVGILAKIDLLDADKLEQRHTLARGFAKQLPDLNTIVPVSAGLKRALDLLSDQKLMHFISTLQAIPRQTLDETLDRMLASSELYLSPALKCPLSHQQRLALWKSWATPRPWGVFATIVRLAARADPQQGPQPVRAALNKLAGSEQLERVLREHIFQRSSLLRSSRILKEALNSIHTLQRTYGQARRAEPQGKAFDRFLTLVRQAGGNEEIAQLITTIQGTDGSEAALVEDFTGRLLGLLSLFVRQRLEELKQDFTIIRKLLDKCNENFEALSKLSEEPDSLSPEEKQELNSLLWVYTWEEEQELRSLLGEYNAHFDRQAKIRNERKEAAKERQPEWEKGIKGGTTEAQRLVAELAVRRYGALTKGS